MEGLIAGEAFIEALNKAGIVPDDTRNVSIRASVGEPMQIMYDDVEDGEPVVTTVVSREPMPRGWAGSTRR